VISILDVSPFATCQTTRLEFCRHECRSVSNPESTYWAALHYLCNDCAVQVATKQTLLHVCRCYSIQPYGNEWQITSCAVIFQLHTLQHDRSDFLRNFNGILCYRGTTHELAAADLQKHSGNATSMQSRDLRADTYKCFQILTFVKLCCPDNYLQIL